MATGRTTSANFLTKRDEKIILLCEQISQAISNSIKRENLRKDFISNYGKISYTRDAGAGRGGGKLQRDALCTRGRQGKAPFSNRNLRWHPLVVAEKKLDYAKEIDEIEIEGQDETQTLVFVIKGRRYPSDKVHELTQRYVVLPKHWVPHIDVLKYWSDTLWTQNSCVVPALESCEWYQAVETYAILGMAIAVEGYSLEFKKISIEVKNILARQNVDKNIVLPSRSFPSNKEEIIICPMCKISIFKIAANVVERERGDVWQPRWRKQKRGEGEDSSIQIMHLNPLVEKIISHSPKNVRYGHRWCNVAMTDHSLTETLDFMEYIVRVHKRC